MKIILGTHKHTFYNNCTNPTLNIGGEGWILSLKPESSLLKDGKPLYRPDFTQSLQAELGVIVKINRLGKNIAHRFAHRYYQQLGIGLNLTAGDVLSALRADGLPWDTATAFDGSLPMGDFLPKEEFLSVEGQNYISLTKKDETLYKIDNKKVINNIDEVIEQASRYFTLKIGDLLWVNIGEKPLDITIGDRLEGNIGSHTLLHFEVK